MDRSGGTGTSGPQGVGVAVPPARKPAAQRVPLDPRVARSRAAVLAATLELLVERGITATTIEAVADRSGVAKTTIYRQWNGQPSLVLDAIATTFRAPTDPDTGTLRADLLDLVGGLADALSTGQASRLMPALIDAAERDPAFTALHRREALGRHHPALTAVTRAIGRGELAPDVDPTDVLDMVAGPLFYRRFMSGGTVDRAFARRVVDVVLASYRREPKHG